MPNVKKCGISAVVGSVSGNYEVSQDSKLVRVSVLARGGFMVWIQIQFQPIL
jgi:hypothetical protein